MKNHPLHHKFLKSMRERGLVDRPLLIAASGGLDSMVLVDLVFQVKRLLKSEVGIATVHHGDSGSPEQIRFRDDSALLVSHEAGFRGCSVFNECPESGVKLTSEAEFRSFRYRSLFNIREKWRKDAAIVTAHHLDDVLETRLLRLIRGVGPQGLNVFPTDMRQVYRPLSLMARSELEDYCHQMKIQYLEDPSNSGIDPLRNWLRLELIPQIEDRCPGGANRLGNSLESISSSLMALASHTGEVSDSGRIKRTVFQTLEVSIQKNILAQFFRSEGLKNYSQNQISEVLKRLHRNQKIQKVPIGGRTFVLDREHLYFSPKGH